MCDWDTGPLEIRASTQAGCYVPGQAIEISIEVINACCYDVYELNVSLQEVGMI